MEPARRLGELVADIIAVRLHMPAQRAQRFDELAAICRSRVVDDLAGRRRRIGAVLPLGEPRRHQRLAHIRRAAYRTDDLRLLDLRRSEERRSGNECSNTVKTRVVPYLQKKKQNILS